MVKSGWMGVGVGVGDEEKGCEGFEGGGETVRGSLCRG